MVLRKRSVAAAGADFGHKVQQLSMPWKLKPKAKYSHSHYYYPNQATDVTSHCHIPPPKHSYHPDVLKAPDPFYGRLACDVTEWQRYISGMNPPSEEYYFGIQPTDISSHLKTDVPSINNSNNEVYWGRPKSYVTDPTVSPSLTPPGRPLDGKGTQAAMSWPAQSHDDQIPLGKPSNKMQSVQRALERAQRTERGGLSNTTVPRPRPRKVGEKLQRWSPGQPVGKAMKEFNAPPSLKIKIPNETDGMYWGRTKSYITDYAVSPTMTPPPRPNDGRGALEAMTFVSIMPQLDDKVPIGKVVQRMKAMNLPCGPSASLEKPKFQPRNRIHQPDSCGGSPPSAPRDSNDKTFGLYPEFSSMPGPLSDRASPPPLDPTLPLSSIGKFDEETCLVHSPASLIRKVPSMSCKVLRAKREENIRWRDQITSAKSSEQRIDSPCCDKRKVRHIPRRPALVDIKCINHNKAALHRPKFEKPTYENGLHQKVQMGMVFDPHHDQEWFGRSKCYITDSNVSPNLTPPRRESFRTPQEKAASMAKYLAKKVPREPPPPPKPPRHQKPPPTPPTICDSGLHFG